MLEKYKIQVLRYLLNQNSVVQNYLPGIENIEQKYIPTVLNDLVEMGLVEIPIGHVFINQNGIDYILKYDLDELPKNELSIHIGHNISGSTIQGSDFKIDNSSNTNNPTNEKNVTKGAKKYIKFILIIIGLISGVITIYDFYIKK